MIKILFTLILTSMSLNTLAGVSTIISTAPLHQQAHIQSPVISQLKTGTSVETIKRKGGWKLVKTQEKPAKFGWIRSYKVRQGHLRIVNSTQNNHSFFTGLANLSRKASGLFSSQKKDYSFQSTATIGVRGLSQQDIKNAQADLKQLSLLTTYRASKASSISFAKQGQLKAIHLKHLPPSTVEK